MSPAEAHLLPAEEVPMVKPAWRNIQKKKSKRQQQETVAESVMGFNPHGQNSWASWPGTCFPQVWHYMRLISFYSS